MIVYVINLDSEPDKWKRAKEHYESFPGLDVRRWPATPPDGQSPTRWFGQHDVADKPRRIAIVRSYRKLLQHLVMATAESEWVIVQDDVLLSEHPAREEQSDIHIYAGRNLQRMEKGVDGFVHPTGESLGLCDPYESAHVCPKAFRLRRSAIGPLLGAWIDERRQACESWTPYLTPATTTYDSQEGAQLELSFV